MIGFCRLGGQSAMFALLITASTGALFLSAQVTTATISGTVTDASGASIPEAAVQVKNLATGSNQTTVSDGQGRFTYRAWWWATTTFRRRRWASRPKFAKAWS